MANYELNQYNQQMILNSDSTLYLQLVNLPCMAVRARAARDENVESMNINVNQSYYDECVMFTGNANFGTTSQVHNLIPTFYLHTKIKRLSTNQIFSVSLINIEQNNDGLYDQVTSTKKQFLRNIVVQKSGLNNDWVNFEIIFTPDSSEYNAIIFELSRDSELNHGSEQNFVKRYPRIIYEELSIINNLIPTLPNTSDGKKLSNLLKIGVQSHSGLMMCINKEEIHVGRSGIYELRNGIITINFFSIISAADTIFSSDGTEVQRWNVGASTIPNIYKNIYPTSMDDLLLKLSEEQNFEDVQNDDGSYQIHPWTNSVCIFGLPKTRTIPNFTLDYLGKED